MRDAKEHGMLYSADMVLADLKGGKHQTRRPVTFQNSEGGPRLKRNAWPYLMLHEVETQDLVDLPIEAFPARLEKTLETFFIAPRIQPGDLLWFRETVMDLRKTPVIGAGSEKYKGMNYCYRADNTKETEVVGRWTPSIHMPREASRIEHKVAEVRLQRVQDISGEDAKAEGVIVPEALKLLGEFYPGSTHKVAFPKLWDSKYGDGPHAWKNNPLVWVYDYEKKEG